MQLLPPSLDIGRMAAALDTVARQQGTVTRFFQRHFGPGTILGNLVLLCDENVSLEARRTAVQMLADSYFRRPIPWQRWGPVKLARDARAEAEAKARETVLRESVIAALHLVTGRLREPRVGVRLGNRRLRGPVKSVELKVGDYVQWFRSQVANEICEDFLGPDWRRESELPLDLVNTESDPMRTELEVSLRFLVEELEEQANLTEREAEVLALTAIGYRAPEIGAAIGDQPSTVRVLLHKARKKVAACKRF